MKGKPEALLSPYRVIDLSDEEDFLCSKMS